MIYNEFIIIFSLRLTFHSLKAEQDFTYMLRVVWGALNCSVESFSTVNRVPVWPEDLKKKKQKPSSTPIFLVRKFFPVRHVPSNSHTENSNYTDMYCMCVLWVCSQHVDCETMCSQIHLDKLPVNNRYCSSALHSFFKPDTFSVVIHLTSFIVFLRAHMLRYAKF